MAICLGIFACNDNAKVSEVTEEQSQKDRVEILYFHGKQRCTTCLAIEKNVKEAIETQFPNELKTGAIIFKSIDISQSENEKIAEKYKVTWSSLFFCKWKDGKEVTENLTKYAFANACITPERFKSGVIKKVNALLK